MNTHFGKLTVFVVDYVMTWVEDQIDNEEIFPVQESQPFPDDFEEYIRDIFKKMFRIFAIIFHNHFEHIEGKGAAAHLNTCFKHFYFFTLEFNLIRDEKELDALEGPVNRMKEQWESQE